jgi:hypothetical protein
MVSAAPKWRLHPNCVRARRRAPRIATGQASRPARAPARPNRPPGGRTSSGPWALRTSSGTRPVRAARLLFRTRFLAREAVAGGRAGRIIPLEFRAQTCANDDSAQPVLAVFPWFSRPAAAAQLETNRRPGRQSYALPILTFCRERARLTMAPRSVRRSRKLPACGWDWPQAGSLRLRQATGGFPCRGPSPCSPF